MLDELYPKVVPGPPKPKPYFAKPRVFSLPAGVERYVVEGCGAILIRLEQGDTLDIHNTEGGQPCEIVCADDTGSIDPSGLGTKGQGPAYGLQALLAGDDTSLRSLRMGIEARGLDLAQPGTIRLFERTTPAKTQQSFTATRTCTVIVAAPGGIMDFERQDTATPLEVFVKRAVIKPVKGFELPDPLADPVADIRIHSATAQAYFVKAGDYIQILDVDGRQCHGFPVFRREKARQRDRACTGCNHHADLDGARLSDARPACEIL